MYKAASRKIGIFLTGFILLAWAVIVPPSLGAAGLHELSDVEMASVSAQGFSSFTLDTSAGTVTLDFSGVTLSTWTEISSLNMGYYLKGGTTAWDNSWANVSLGTSGTDLVLQGLYIQAGFSGDITNPATRQLNYVNIGTNNLTGTISANFINFSGTIGGTPGGTYNRSYLGPATITSDGSSGFYLSLQRSGSQMGYSFNFGTGSHL